MTTIISKCLAVFTTVASIVFLAFVGATAIGGTNWKAESEKLTAFVFEKKGESAASWSVKARRPGSTFSVSNLLLPEAIAKARGHLKQRQQDELNAIGEETPQLQVQLEEAQNFIKIDEAAIQTCISRLKRELKALNGEIEKLSLDGIETSRQTQAINADLHRRREEVFRLKTQFEEILVDTFKATEQQKRLRDELIQVEGNIGLLTRREKQLLQARATVEPESTK